jgi:hydroxyethylthiazole kinase-like sugar kinase family protein
MDKVTANFCEYFEMIRREWKGKGVDAREDKARENMKKLLGD